MALSAKTAVKIEISDPNYVHFHRSNPDLLKNHFENPEILKKSIPKTQFLKKSLRPQKNIEKAVGQNVKNRPPMAPNQFLDPSYRTAASPGLRFTPPNIPKPSPESSFDHPDPAI